MFAQIQPSNSRPVWVWIISAYYVFSGVISLLFMWLLWNGTIPPEGAQGAALKSVTTLDWIGSQIISIVSLAGGVFLFLLRKRAVTFFLIGLVMSVVFNVYYAVRIKSSEALLALLIACVGWVIKIAVIWYARRLARRGVLI
jgi:hypothetical protein